MIGVAIIGLGVLIYLICFTKVGVLFKGFANLFVKDMAQTPEGAEAIYQEAIEKAQDRYSEASDALQLVVGQLETAKNNLARSQAYVKECETKCERLVTAGHMEDARIYADERSMALAKVEEYQSAVEELQAIKDEAQQLFLMHEQQLKKLKADQVTVVESLRRNTQIKSMYDQLDSLKKDTNLDKMMGYVKEGATQKREMVTGARVLHENRSSTKVTKAQEHAMKLDSDNYLESLKAKSTRSLPGK